MKKILFIIIAFIMSISIFTQDDQNNLMNNMNSLKVKIELANPKIYSQNDEIYINVKIFNTSNDEKIFLIAKDKRYSFDFKLVNMQNRSIEHSNEYVSSFYRPVPIFNSQIRLAGQEGYVFKARLNDYYDLNITGQFFIKCYFYPDLKLENNYNDTVISNQLSLNIRPSGIKEDKIIEMEELEKEKKYYATKRPPDEVIAFMLDARMNKEWEKYFLYIDLQKLILTNNDFKQRYLKADAERQKEILYEYSEYLKEDKISNISLLPIKYEILRTEYTKGMAKVEVFEHFKFENYLEKKYYTYFLNKKGNIWYVTSYEVLNYK